MSKESEFLIYCMERYRYHKGLTGKEVAALFKESGASSYLLSFFGALHTVGEEYLMNDIEEYITQSKHNKET